MLKISKYTIIIPLKKLDKYILVHGYTGAIDIISKDIYINIFKKDINLLSKISTEYLIKRGHLTKKDVEEEGERVKMMSQILSKHQAKKMNFTFIVTYDCNFRCPYCYEGQISGGGIFWTKEIITDIQVKQAFKIIDNEYKKSGIHTLTLFWGEPLLKENINIVSMIVKEGIKRNHKISAITNGYDLDKYESLIGPGKISNLQITLDGGEESHNNKRIHKDDKSTFSKIMGNISLALTKKVNVSLRINIDRNNINDLSELAEIFFENGWTTNNKFNCYIAPIRECDNNLDNSNSCFKDNKTYSTNELYKQISSLRMSDNKYKVFNPPRVENKTGIKNAILNKHSIPFKGDYCGATNNNIIFDPRGDIYTCLEFVGRQNMKVGSYNIETSIENFTFKNKYGKRKIFNMEKCKDCKYALFCGGGCVAFSEKFYGDMMVSYCDSFSSTFNKQVIDAYLEIEGEVGGNK